MAKPLTPELGEIYEHLLALSTTVGELLLDQQLSLHSKRIAECTEGLLAACRNLRVAGMPISWRQCVLSFRSLERTVALVAAVNSLARARSRAQPYAALIHDGVTELSQWLDAVRDHGKRLRKRAYISGPVMELRAGSGAQGGPFGFGVTSAAGRKMLIGGIGADVLDLLEDWARSLSPYRTVDTAARRRVAPSAFWLRASTTMDLNWLRRASWPCGDLMSVSDFASAIGESAPDVRKMIGREQLLALRTWDGSIVLPAVQLSSSGPTTVRPYLASLLRSVRHEVGDSWWPLALWLGISTQNVVHADLLDTRDGYGQLIQMLDRHEALRDSAAPARPLTHLPKSSTVADTLSKLPSAKMQGNAAIEYAYMNNVAENDEIDDLDGNTAYRITDRRYGPFFFRSAHLQPGTGGRFDLPLDGKGSCYLAESAEGAISEVARRLLVLDIQQVASRSLWQLIPMEDQPDLLDLTSDHVRKHLGYQSTDDLYAGTRSASQQLAEMALLAGYSGIKYPLRHLEGHSGWALFAEGGAHSPELVGRGSWGVQATPVAESEEFWNWVLASSKAQSLYPIFNQLPLSAVG